MSRMNTPSLVGANAYVPADCPNLFLPDRLWQLHPTTETHGPWLGFVTTSARFRAMIRATATGTSNSMKNVSQEAVLNLPVAVPPKPVQHSIGGTLQSWKNWSWLAGTEIITKQRRLVILREFLASGPEALYPQATHFPIEALGNLAIELNQRNNGQFGRCDVMGVLKGRGLTPMKENLVATDISRYLVVPPRTFAYNPMRINVGSIAMSEFKRNVLVSPDYVVFACEAEKLLPEYLNHLRRTERWAKFVAASGNGSVRIRIYFGDLADFEFRVPPPLAQRRIVAALDDAEREIELLQTQQRLTLQQNESLATQLLTGQLTANRSPAGAA